MCFVFITAEYTKDLPSYLQFCKDVAFAVAGPSNVDHRDEEDLIEKLWDFYLDEKVQHNFSYSYPRNSFCQSFSLKKKSMMNPSFCSCQ